MTIEDDDDLEALKLIGRIVADVLAQMGGSLEPGITTKELDDIGRALLEGRGAQSAPILDYAFPGATCISLNECVAHGIPDDTPIRAGDMVNIDVSAELDGYYADTGSTFLVPPSLDVQKSVCHATREARNAAVKALRHGSLLNEAGWAVEQIAQKHKLKIIENLAGHGVGRSLHEAPGSVYSHYIKSDKRTALKGMVLAIEPFLSTRSSAVVGGGDGWSLMLDKGGYAAQYEHTVVITRGEPIILTHPSAVYRA